MLLFHLHCVYEFVAYRAVQWHFAKRAEAHFLAEPPEIIPYF